MMKANIPVCIFVLKMLRLTLQAKISEAELDSFITNLLGEITSNNGESKNSWVQNFYLLFCINQTKTSSGQNTVWIKPSMKRHTWPLSRPFRLHDSQEKTVRSPSACLALNKRIGTFLKSDDRGKFNYQTGCLESISLSLSTNLIYSSFSV